MERVAQAAPEAVAVALLHSYAHPEHERELGELLAERLPGVHVSLSHELVGTFREYERAATTEVDAALSPLLGEYLRRLSREGQRDGAARARDHAVLRRDDRLRASGGARGADGALGPRGGRGGSADARARGGCGERAVLRHGRNLVRCVRDRRMARWSRRPSAAWRAGRWRCRRSTSTRSERAEARSRGATPEERCAWARSRRARSPAPRATGAAARSRR